mmetsp:Transcript_34263/g.85342  ORF Transcript_34263/g.85342 Transcript_34263/m.85342 type:complete len:185 (-) Transcript_34263:1500-2054(-)
MAAHVRVGVGVILQHPETKLVLVGRRKGSHGAGRLALPGGHLELGETWQECGARELLEEAGVSVAQLGHVATTNDPMPDEGKHYVTLFVHGWLPDGAVPSNCEPDKNEGWEWWSLEQLRALPPSELFLPLANLLHSSQLGTGLNEGAQLEAARAVGVLIGKGARACSLAVLAAVLARALLRRLR